MYVILELREGINSFLEDIKSLKECQFYIDDTIVMILDYLSNWNNDEEAEECLCVLADDILNNADSEGFGDEDCKKSAEAIFDLGINILSQLRFYGIMAPNVIRELEVVNWINPYTPIIQVTDLKKFDEEDNANT